MAYPVVAPPEYKCFLCGGDHYSNDCDQQFKRTNIVDIKANTQERTCIPFINGAYKILDTEYRQ